jgi:hypothetical protein
MFGRDARVSGGWHTPKPVGSIGRAFGNATPAARERDPAWRERVPAENMVPLSPCLICILVDSSEKSQRRTFAGTVADGSRPP